MYKQTNKRPRHTISKRNFTTGFKRTSTSSSNAKHSTPKKAEARLVLDSNQLSIDSAFMRVGGFVPDEERLVLSKPVVKFSFIYGVSRGLLFVYL